MIGALRSLLASLPLLATRARLATLLFAAQLLLAVVVLLPLSYAFDANFGRSVAGHRTAAGDFVEYAWQDWHLHHGDLLATAERAFSGVALVGLFLSFTLLSGGTFALLARAQPATFAEFFGGAGRIFGRFARLFVLFAAGCAAVAWLDRGLSAAATALVTERLHRGASSLTTALVLHAKTAWVALLLGWLVAACGLAKARLAATDERSTVRAFLGAWQTVLRNPVGSALLAAFGVGSVAASVALYVVVRDALPVGATTTLGERAVPTWLLHLLLAQGVAWLGQAATVVWANAFLRFERATSRRDPSATPIAAPLQRVPLVVAALVTLGLASPRAAARQSAPPAAAPAAAQTAAPTSAPWAAPFDLPKGPFAVEYAIAVTLDPRSHTLLGSETVTFRNRSKSPVGELLLHLYANAFSSPTTTFLTELRHTLGKDPLAGLSGDAFGRCDVTNVKLGGKAARLEIGPKPYDRTVARVALPQSLEPGASVTLQLEFTTVLPRAELSGRGGFLGDHVDAMQWFPKLATFRDGRFECEPFHADTEFFADFGAYDVTITTPKSFVVGATGAKTEEVELPADSGSSEPLVRRRFLASAVHDFAWCADPHFVECDDVVHDAAHDVAVRYLCQPYALEKRQVVLETTRRCLQRYADWFVPYPYPTLTIDGLPMGAGGGMEYPTLFTISQGFPNHLPWLAESTEEPVSVTAHEFGHQLWYGILASDEVHEAWLDEGVNTYVTTKVCEELLGASPGRAPRAAEWREVFVPFLEHGLSVRAFDQELGLTPLVGFAASPFRVVRRGRPTEPTLFGFPVPIGRTPGFHEPRLLEQRERYVPVAGASALSEPSYALRPGSYVGLTYGKTALALATLESLYGWDAVRESLQTYAERFAFSHPRGDDLLAVLREVVPQRSDAVKNVPLAPLLDQLFRTDAVLDLAVTDAASPPSPSGSDERPLFDVHVVVENLGTIALPSRVRLRYDDGHEEWESFPADRRSLTIDRVRPNRLVSAEVDPEHLLRLDLDWTNNGRTAAPQSEATRRFDAAALFWIESALALLRSLSGP